MDETKSSNNAETSNQSHDEDAETLPATSTTVELPVPSSTGTSHAGEDDQEVGLVSSTLQAPSSNSPSKKDDLHALCADMFSKIGLYMNSEIDVTVEDYKLLEKMNLAAIEKYEHMHQMAKTTGDNLHSLNQKIVDIQPYLDQIESIEASVLALEQAAYKLDAYSKRLEDRFKKIQRR